MKFAFLLTFCMLTTLFAHKLNLFMYDEAGKLYIQSYFTQSSPCKACEVVLLDKEQKELAKTVTNEEGKVVIPLPSSSFTVIVNAQMGHQQQAGYEVQSQKEDTQVIAPPPVSPPTTDTPWQKVVFGLLIIATIFTLFYRIKRSK